MASLFPREEHAEALFHRILSNPGAEQQLYETFCMEQENASFEDGGGAECSFAKALCGRSPPQRTNWRGVSKFSGFAIRGCRMEEG